MLTRWSDFDRSFAALDELRRQMSTWLDAYERPSSAAGQAMLGHSWPRMNLFDNGSELVLRAAAPGLSEKDIELTLTGDTLAISGQRTVPAFEGFSAHRQERGNVKFARSFALPSQVDPKKVKASVKDGMLTVTMAKAAEAKPRQITVKAG